MSHDLTATDIRKLLKKFPPTNPRERVYVSVTLALLDRHELVESQVKGLAELFGSLLTALEIDPRQLLAMRDTAGAGQTTIEGDDGGGSSGTAGMGGSGAAASGAGAGGGVGGGGAGPGPANPIKDSTPFPAGAAASAPPGTKPRVVVQEKAPSPSVEEIPEPNVQSGPAVNARPNVVPPPVNGTK